MFWMDLGWFFDCDVEDFDVFSRFVVFVDFHFFNFKCDVHSSGDTAKDGVLSIQPGSWNGCDEELRAVGVGSGICHADDSWSIVPELVAELIFKFTSPNRFSTRPISQRISSLKHEALNDTMEKQAVIIAILGMGTEILYRAWTLVWKELNLNVSLDA